MVNKNIASLIVLSTVLASGCAKGTTCEDTKSCESFELTDDGEGGSGGSATTTSSTTSASSSAMTTGSGGAGGSDASASNTVAASSSSGVEPVDVDGDGFTTLAGDCDDANPSIHPNVNDTYGDGVDKDCDGLDYDSVHLSSGVHYVLVPEWTTAPMAASRCTELGYERLAEIKSMEEQAAQANLPSQAYLEAFSGNLFGAGKRMWIGLTKNGNTVKWGSGAGANFLAWFPNEPSGDGNCVEGDAAQQGFPNGGWNDITCDHQMPFVCESRRVQPVIK